MYRCLSFVVLLCATECVAKAQDDVARFVGRWVYASGTQETVCTDGSKTSDPLKGTRLKEITRGQGATVQIDWSLVVGSAACILRFDVSGDKATVRPITCREPIPFFDFSRVIEFRSFTMTTADGETMKLSNVQIFSLTATSGSCTNTITDATLGKEGSPSITISTTSLVFNAQTGTNPPQQTFTVRNSGTGTLNYQISTNQPWLSVSPASGSSTGPANTVTASVNTAGMGPGNFNGEIRVSQTPGTASPVVIAVRLNLTEVSNVSAATFLKGSLAAESIASAFGQALAESTEVASVVPLPTSLAGTSVKVKDSAGSERLAPLFFVSPGQINYLVPEGTRPGAATMTATRGSQVAGTGTLQIDPVAPVLFTANADGKGVPAALAIRASAEGAQTSVPVFQCGTGGCSPAPIDLGSESDQVILLLFGTGIRGRTALPAVNVKIGGTDAEALYAGPQGGLVGLDQVNVRLPRSLAARGEVDLVLTADGVKANTVRVSIR